MYVHYPAAHQLAYIMLLKEYEDYTEDETMRVALTIWQGRISPVFDTARSMIVADIEEARLLSQRNETFGDDSAQEKIGRLHALGVDVLVCGAVSRPLADLAVSRGIRLLPFVSGELGEVLTAVIAGRMPDAAFAMPGCGRGCGRRFRTRRGGCATMPHGAPRSCDSEAEKIGPPELGAKGRRRTGRGPGCE